MRNKPSKQAQRPCFPGLGDYDTLEEFAQACESFIEAQEERAARSVDAYIAAQESLPTWDDVRALAEERGLRFSSGVGSNCEQEQVWVGRPGPSDPLAFMHPTCIVLGNDPDGPAKLIAWIEETFPLPIIPDRAPRLRTMVTVGYGLVPLPPPYNRRRGLRGLIDRLFR